MRTKTRKIRITDYGSFLGRAEGCLTIRHSDKRVESFPLFSNEVSEIDIAMGNSASITALSTIAMWGIDCVFLTSNGRPVAYLKSFEDDSHVKTRVAQYEAIKNGKGLSIAREIVLAKILGQNQVLRKHGFRQHDIMQIKKRITEAKTKNSLMTIEGHCSDNYFSQVFRLWPRWMNIKHRRGFKAFDAGNNVMNLTYEILRWKVYRAIIRAKLEPFLGVLHTETFSKPSLLCDLQELYRFLVDDFLIDYCKTLRKKDFLRQPEEYSKNKKGQREFLRKDAAKNMIDKLNLFFETKVQIQRIRNGKKQSIETLISEEALLLAQYLRNEKRSWKPRLPNTL